MSCGRWDLGFVLIQSPCPLVLGPRVAWRQGQSFVGGGVAIKVPDSCSLWDLRAEGDRVLLMSLSHVFSGRSTPPGFYDRTRLLLLLPSGLL